MKTLSCIHLLRICCLLAVLCFGPVGLLCAQIPSRAENRGPGPEPSPKESASLENLAERNQADITDDSRETELTSLQKHPLNLNRAGEEELAMLPEITAARISALILYRQQLGDLISIHELQAVPGWNPAFIRSLLPYVYVGKDESLAGAVSERWLRGDNTLLFRSSAAVEKSAGYRNDSTGYLGSPQKVFLRYSYNFKQLLQYGFSGEKDPGEPFFRGARRDGFDFYSFHFFLRQSGIIRALAIGDFTVNFGQGLIAWQTIAFAKGGGVAAIKRQAPALKPYHSAGEFNFHRGLGITLSRRNWTATVFLSRQPVSTHPGSDTLSRDDVFTSFQNSGYHRTAREMATRNNNHQLAAGGNLIWHSAGFEAGVNAVYYRFSASFEKRDEPYNVFAFRGKQLSAESVHYGYTLRNWHFFGEAAVDQRGHPALLQGAAGSLSRNLDLGFVYRNISRSYQSLYADAFTQNSSPVNESGLYSVLAIGPWKGWKMEMYYDLFQSPWLRYRDDAPGFGKEWSVSAGWQPEKKWVLRFVCRSRSVPVNRAVPENRVHVIKQPVKQSFSAELEYHFAPALSAKWRSEAIWIQRDPDKTGIIGQGNLSFLEIFYHNIIMNGNCRIQRFDIPGYDYRIYIYESDMMYNFALPAYYNSGWSYYININRTLFKKSGTKSSLRGWLRWSQTIYQGNLLSGSGLDAVSGSRRSHWSVQFLYDW